MCCMKRISISATSTKNANDLRVVSSNGTGCISKSRFLLVSADLNVHLTMEMCALGIVMEKTCSIASNNDVVES